MSDDTIHGINLLRTPPSTNGIVYTQCGLNAFGPNVRFQRGPNEEVTCRSCLMMVVWRGRVQEALIQRAKPARLLPDIVGDIKKFIGPFFH